MNAQPPYIDHARNSSLLGMFHLLWGEAGHELHRQGKALQALATVQALLDEPADAPETEPQQPA